MATTNPNDYYKVQTSSGYDIYDKATNHKYTYEELLNPQGTGFVVNADHIPVGQVPQEQQNISPQNNPPPNNPPSPVTPGQEQIRRQGNDFYYISPNGQETHLSQAQFQSMGINADFVKPGQTVSMAQAKTGSTGATQVMAGVNGYYTVDAGGNRIQDFPVVNGDYNAAMANAQSSLKQAQSQQSQSQQSITGNPMLDSWIEALQKIVDSNLEANKIINPNITIDAITAQKFIDEAATQIDPYYSSQMKAAKSDLDVSFQELQKSYDQAKAEKEQQFKQSLGSQQEQEAGVGTIFSGGRTRREGEMAQATDRSLQALQDSTLSRGRTLGTSAERSIGSLGLTGISTPTIQGYKTSGLGAFVPTTSRSLYTPEMGVMGSLEREQETAKQNRIADLRRNWISDQSLNY